ncbi:acylphosphatase [Corynebacterium caspium]|uniref:acylphosphatase n=1 Tax=Corynebacterium caspium TaxID=234828 RepID=UPI00035D1B79|nr:acylphosphatase [Corynebacterium caspium]WKD59047.1 Acylphosphatase [Corynebacterium caspium DSM 44850]
MDPKEPKIRLTAFVHGNVQGVGFRWWTRGQALEFGLSGKATNMPDGRVCVVAEGDVAQCAKLLEALKEEPSTRRRPGNVRKVIEQWSENLLGVAGFTIY